MSKTIIIQGSARSIGNTSNIIKHLSSKLQFDLVDLKTKNFSGYDYSFKNADDDFLPLAANLINNYDKFIFATPVYWYSMSGLMKNFLDRFSDLLGPHKELGRKLRGKSIGVISCSGDNDIQEAMYMPFKESAKYLGMTYLGEVHGWHGENKEIHPEAINLLEEFADKLNT